MQRKRKVEWTPPAVICKISKAVQFSEIWPRFFFWVPAPDEHFIKSIAPKDTLHPEKLVGVLGGWTPPEETRGFFKLRMQTGSSEKDGGRCGEVALLPHFREQDVVFLAMQSSASVHGLHFCTHTHTHTHTAYSNPHPLCEIIFAFCEPSHPAEGLKRVKVKFQLL